MVRPPRESGFTLVETLVSLLSLGLAVGAILTVAGAAERGMVLTREGAQAREFATALYEDPSAIAALAPARGRQGHGRDAAPKWEAIDGASVGWERRVATRWVDPERPERTDPRGASNLLEGTIEIRHRGTIVHTLRFLRHLE